jgi:NDP-sugar pyrophosphorylase family protein
MDALVLSSIDGGGICNMTDVIDSLISSNKPVYNFPIHEYWSDVGTPTDLKNARLDIQTKVFSPILET